MAHTISRQFWLLLLYEHGDAQTAHTIFWTALLNAIRYSRGENIRRLSK